MLKAYFTIAYRNFIRNKIFSIINVAGLSIGISTSLVIFLIVHYDFGFDKFENNRQQLYRVVTDDNYLGTILHAPGVPSPMAAAVKKEVTGVAEVIGFHQYKGNPRVTVPRNDNNKPFAVNHQTQVILADPSYFKLINYSWLAGSASSIEKPFRVVLTEDRAKLYFPSIPYTSVIGRQVIYDDSVICTVSGIVGNLTENTDFVFKEFISQSSIQASGLKVNYSWGRWGSIDGGSQLILRLSAHASPKNIESQIQSLEKKYNKASNPTVISTFRLQPFSDIHFNTNYGTFGDHTANKTILYGLFAVGVFLLMLACINFINLATAQSVERAKEIGVRKTLGSSRKQLIIQFLTETSFFTFISFILSLIVTPLLLKLFAAFIPADLHFNPVEPYLIVFGLMLMLAVSLLAGFYPAVVLSGFSPALALKNHAYKGNNSSRSSLIRKSLTISQFLIAQVFVMATLIAVKQISFMLTKDMGFKSTAIITVQTPFIWGASGRKDDRRKVLLNDIKGLPGVEMASLGSDPPATDGWSSNDMTYKDGKKEIETDVRQKYGDSNYLSLYKIPLLAGRYVRQSDTASEYVINETYMHILGFQKPEDVINKQINKIPIVGVVADFNQESLHTHIKPLAFSSAMGNSFVLHIALASSRMDNWKSVIASIEQKFEGAFPEEDFSYQFLDQRIAKFYRSERNLSGLLKWATGLAIFISCMGLLGLVIYSTNIRKKEIGIRKVLGASIVQIVSILSLDFIKLVIIASFVAVPISWWAMHQWLENFAYRTAINGWLFLGAVLFMTVIALVTMSIQTIRSASANPVHSLRSE